MGKLIGIGAPKETAQRAARRTPHTVNCWDVCDGDCSYCQRYAWMESERGTRVEFQRVSTPAQIK